MQVSLLRQACNAFEESGAATGLRDDNPYLLDDLELDLGDLAADFLVEQPSEIETSAKKRIEFYEGEEPYSIKRRRTNQTTTNTKNYSSCTTTSSTTAAAAVLKGYQCDYPLVEENSSSINKCQQFEEKSCISAGYSVFHGTKARRNHVTSLDTEDARYAGLPFISSIKNLVPPPLSQISSKFLDMQLHYMMSKLSESMQRSAISRELVNRSARSTN